MKDFKVITNNENYHYRAESLEQCEYEVIRDLFPDVLDDDLSDKMATVEIVEL